MVYQAMNHIYLGLLSRKLTLYKKRVPCWCWYVLVDFDTGHFLATGHININIEPHKLPFSAQPTVPCSRHFSLWPPRCKPVSPDEKKSYIIKITSSTAQGGGGSFKNRKPIGEVGCCESGMAKRIH
jgi:hypothetical protein